MLLLSHLKYDLSSYRWKLDSPDQLCQLFQLSGWQTWPEHYYQDIIIYSVCPALLMSLSTLIKTLDCFEIIRSLYQEKCVRLDREVYTSKTYFRCLLCQGRELGAPSHLLNIETYWSFKYSLMQKMQPPFISFFNWTVLYQMNLFDTLFPRHREIFE